MVKKVDPEVKVKKAAAAFEIVEVVPGPVVFQGREVDLRTISVKQAKALAAQGLRYIKIIGA